jgi:ABC-type glycerol-3-phosphate transport system substrate-binding protein
VHWRTAKEQSETCNFSWGPQSGHWADRRLAWEAYYANPKRPKPPKNRKVLKEAVEYAHEHPLTGQWGIITYDATDPIEAALEKVFVGQQTVREGVQTWVTQANQNLAKLVAEVKAAKR